MSAPSSSQGGSLAALAFTCIAAATAAAAAFATASAELPVWAMFVGWVGYLTRLGSWKESGWNFLCLASGIALGAVAALAIGDLHTLVGALALPLVVFVVAAVVVTLRFARGMNNLMCYFLGLIAFFAAHGAPTPMTFLRLSIASLIGFVAAWLSMQLQRHVPSQQSA
jgi:hypothetical protein